MAATNMTKAGLEVGCKVTLRPSLRHGVVTALDVGLVAPRVEVESMGRRAPYRPDEVMRDYDDAQAARQKRFTNLLELFPGDAGVPEESDTIERYVCVQKNNHPTGDGSHAFQWGDTFDEAVELAGGEILDGWNPVAVWDLDTGEKIDLHVSSPVITIGEDRNATVNELDPDELAESREYRERNYTHVKDKITVAIECDPAFTEEARQHVESLYGRTGITSCQVNVEPVHQHNITAAASN